MNFVNRHSQKKPLPLIVMSFIVALFLTILPLPLWAAWFRPEWSLLVFLYWCYKKPDCVGVFTAFILGLCIDCLYGSALGVHSVALIVVAMGTMLTQRTYHVHGILVQMIIILFLAITYQCSLMVINALLKQQIPYYWAYWAPALILTLLWPWLTLLLDMRVGRQ